MKAVKDALADGFGVAPVRVLQSSYEPIQYDETGALCGSQPTLGMDVHPGLKLDRGRLAETAQFLGGYWALIHEEPKRSLKYLNQAVELAPEWYLPILYRAALPPAVQ